MDMDLTVRVSLLREFRDGTSNPEATLYAALRSARKAPTFNGKNYECENPAALYAAGSEVKQPPPRRLERDPIAPT